MKTVHTAFYGKDILDLEKSINNTNLNTNSISFVPEQLRSGFMLPRYGW